MRRLSPYILCLSFFMACSSEPVPLNPNAYVGTYEFEYEELDQSFDSATDHELDRLVLQSDGRYSLVQGGSTKSISEAEGAWSLFPGMAGQPCIIQLDYGGYPIHVKNGRIYLGISDDLGQYYVKKE